MQQTTTLKYTTSETNIMQYNQVRKIDRKNKRH